MSDRHGPEGRAGADSAVFGTPGGAMHGRDGRIRAAGAVGDTDRPRVPRAAVPATRARGFSLVEVVITVAIVALLASIAAPLYETVVRRSKEQDLKAALYRIRDAIDAYKLAADAGHIEKLAGASGYPASLAVLVEGVRDVRSISGAKFYFLRRIPRDPFADPRIAPEQTWGLRSYGSPPDNPRPGDDVFDVYSLSPGTALNGIPYREW